MLNIAIITARGGSKRIPRKNIKEFCGKPIIAYSIEAAIQSNLFDEVMVSTDDAEIAEIAKEYGAVVPFMRSAETSNDYAGTEDVLEEVLNQYKKRRKHFQNMCCIYPTAPLLQSETLYQAYKIFQEKQADAVVPIVAFSYPPQRSLVRFQGKVKFKWPDIQNQRSQDFETYYHDAGQFYIIRTDTFLKEKTLFPHNTVSVVLDEMFVQDIDNVTDWEMAELKYRLMKQKRVNK